MAKDSQVDAGREGSNEEVELPTIVKTMLEVFSPGVGPQAYKTLKWVFVGLFISLFLMLVEGVPSFHVMVLFGLAMGLAISVAWFSSEVAKARAEGKLPDPAAAEENKSDKKD